MRVLISNNTGREALRLRDRFPELVGHIIAPRGWRQPFDYFALDNGAFSSHRSGAAFDELSFIALCDRAHAHSLAPQWLTVPDVVGNRIATIESWHQWSAGLRTRYGWPLAFVVQPGMSRLDVPADADLIFVGGGDAEWKRDSADFWCHHFERVHIGGVNGVSDLRRYAALGAESCDGTGWFRGDRKQLDGLWYYLADLAGDHDDHSGPMQPRLRLK